MTRTAILLTLSLWVAGGAAAQSEKAQGGGTHTTQHGQTTRQTQTEREPQTIRTGPAPEWLEAIAPGFDTVAGNAAEYRRVLDKFTSAIVRPTLRDCAIAYYGFPLQKGFSPKLPGEEDMQRAIMADAYEAAYSIGTQILRHSPVNLTALYWTLFAATETGKPWEVRNSLRGRYNSISRVIAMSGDGFDSETAFKVVWNGDMYSYTMLELGMSIGEGYLWDGRWTELEVTRGGIGAVFKKPSVFFEMWPVQLTEK